MQNFGQINETFKNILADSIVTKDKKGKKIFKAYVKALKENKILKTQYGVYQKLEGKVNVSGDEERSVIFVDECISMLQKLGRNNIIETNIMLSNFLETNGYKLYVDEYDFKSLHEHINNVAFMERSTKNVNTIVESKIFIKNYSNLVEEKENKVVEPYSNKMLLPLMKNKFNEKYSNLTELENKIIKLTISGTDDDKKSLYTGTVRECIDLVNEQLKECSIDQKNTLLQVKDKLLRYDFNTENFTSEMSEMSYLKTTFN
tara:strand:- start:6087 stop:6866 length:780 start_codon:yes stop_codon:yes gene_type:complete